MTGTNHGSPTTDGAGYGAFAQAMAAAMDRMMHDMHATRPTGDADRDFLIMMIPHHQGAVDMAELVLRYGRDPLIRQLAEGLIATQALEIAAMQARLVKPTTAGEEEAFPAMSGTRGPD